MSNEIERVGGEMGPRPRVYEVTLLQLVGAAAVGALAIGALSIGAMAIGSLAIGRLRVGGGRLGGGCGGGGGGRAQKPSLPRGGERVSGKQREGGSWGRSHCVVRLLG